MSLAHAYTPESAPWPQQPSPRPALALVPPPAAPRVLVVEDDPSVADLLAVVLGRDGYDVVVADTGSAALRHALGETFTAVLLDLMIPAPDGVEVLRRLRAAGQVMPVVLLTAKSTMAAREAAIRAGADDYLTKPITPTRLSERISALTSAPTRNPMARANALRASRSGPRRVATAARPSRAPWLERPRGAGDR